MTAPCDWAGAGKPTSRAKVGARSTWRTGATVTPERTPGPTT